MDSCRRGFRDVVLLLFLFKSNTGSSILLHRSRFSLFRAHFSAVAFFVMPCCEQQNEIALPSLPSSTNAAAHSTTSVSTVLRASSGILTASGALSLIFNGNSTLHTANTYPNLTSPLPKNPHRRTVASTSSLSPNMASTHSSNPSPSPPPYTQSLQGVLLPIRPSL